MVVEGGAGVRRQDTNAAAPAQVVLGKYCLVGVLSEPTA